MSQSSQFVLGWNKLANTTTMKGNGQDLCPPNGFGGYDYNFDSLCAGVYQAWTGGVYDSSSLDGPRFLIFGGGHSDYQGIEIYSINIHTQKMIRLTNPSPPQSSCAPLKNSALADGRPNISAHSYGMPVTLPSQKKLIVWSRLTGTTWD